MIIKAITSAIILGSSFFVEVAAQTTAHQKAWQSRSNKSRSNRTVKDPKAAQDETSEAILLRRLETEITALSKLSADNKQEIRASIDELQEEITRVKLGDRLAKTRRKLAANTGSNPFALLQKRLDQSLALLPPRGITATALLQSWDALNDFLILEIGADANVVTNSSLKIIEKYKLKGNSLYLMGLDVLEIAAFNANIASELVRRAN